jgi:integrase
MPRIRLTIRTLNALKGSPSRQVDYWDKSFPRFGVRVSPQGRKTWMILYRYNRRLRRLTLGTYPPTPLEQARKAAREELNKVRDGRDPARERKLVQREGSFTELCDDYIKRHAKPNKKSWRNDQWMINRHLKPVWDHVKVGDITTLDVVALIEGIADRGPKVLANRVLALISKMFSFGIPRGYRADHPCRGLQRPTKERPRDRVLSETEIRKIWESLEKGDPFARALYQLRLLTAQRGGEIRHMKWADINLETGEWTIPATDSKNGIVHTVPLNPKAVDVLKSLQEWQSNRLREVNQGRVKKNWPPKESSGWVFPSPRGDDRPFDWEQKLTRRLREQSGVAFKPHDLRRTASTLLTKYCHVDRFILKRILNHVDSDITAVYDRNLYDDQKRMALNAWGRRLAAIVSGTELTATVLPMSAQL